MSVEPLHRRPIEASSGANRTVWRRNEPRLPHRPTCSAQRHDARCRWQYRNHRLVKRLGGELVQPVGELDVHFTGEPLWFVIGPVPPVEDDDLAAIVEEIAGGGPNYRLGLIPSRSTRFWPVVSKPGRAAVLPPCSLGCRDFEEVVANAEKFRPDIPFAVWRCGEFLCVYGDHGLGDGRLFLRLLQALTTSGAPADPLVRPARVTRFPFSLALWTGLRHRPSALSRGGWELAKSIAVRARMRAPDPSQQRSAPESIETSTVRSASDKPSTVWASSGSDYMRDLRKYRDEFHPGVSTTVMVMFFICASLKSAGINLSADVGILTDLRRFLPAETTTWANFVSVVDVPFSKGTSPEDFSMLMRREVLSYRSLLKLAAPLMVSRVRNSWFGQRARRRHAEAPDGTDEARTTLTLSEFTKPEGNASIGWAATAESRLAVMTDPATRRHLVIILHPPAADRMQVTARFFASHVDPERVRIALNNALKTPWESHATAATEHGGQ
ncbi:MAG: hypothetical protein QOH57_668 [Mycobacterium sp.]|nr:hypothetical protein [Mycobacterium sp.]